MKIVPKPLMAVTAVFTMLAVGCGEGEETTKVVEDDTATSQGSEEPLPVLASNPELPKDRALVKPSVEVSTNPSEAIAKNFTITDLSMEMLWVKPGTFEMGTPPVPRFGSHQCPATATAPWASASVSDHQQASSLSIDP
jgi:hypothetical protein